MFGSVLVLLVLVSFICTILAMLNPPRCPIWVPVLLTSIILLLMVFPKG